MRKALIEIHKAAGATHEKLASLHKAMSDNHSTLAAKLQDSDEDASNAVQKISDTHAEIAATHDSASAFHKDCAAQLKGGKALEVDDLQKILDRVVPDGVKGAGDNSTVKKITLAPRPGQEVGDVEDVPPGLRNMVGA